MPPTEHGSQAVKPDIFRTQLRDLTESFIAQYEDLESRFAQESAKRASAEERIASTKELEAQLAMETAKRISVEHWLTCAEDVTSQLHEDLAHAKLCAKELEAQLSRESAALASMTERLTQLEAREAETSQKFRELERRKEQDDETAELLTKELTIALNDARKEEMRLYRRLDECEKAAPAFATERHALEELEAQPSRESAALASMTERITQLEAREAETSQKFRDLERRKEQDDETAELLTKELTIALSDARKEEMRLYRRLDEWEKGALAFATERHALEDAAGTASDSERGEAEPTVATAQERAGRLPNLPTSKWTLQSLPSDCKWIPKYEHCPTARVRLYVFYGAGMFADTIGFQRWRDTVKNNYPGIELNIFEYPGHTHTDQAHESARRSMPSSAIRDITEFADKFFLDLTESGRQGLYDFFKAGPFAILGLSTGARVAISIAQALIDRYAMPPRKLYVVGRSPPFVDGLKGEFAEYVSPWSLLSPRNQAFYEKYGLRDMYEADCELNRAPLKPLKWRVGQSGLLVKRTEKGNFLEQPWEPGAEVYGTGEEEPALDGGKWVRMDLRYHEDKLPGWFLAKKGSVAAVSASADERALERENDSYDPDESSPFLRVPIPLQVHFSNADVAAPNSRSTEYQWPMDEWSRLTSESKLELVMHKDLQHSELIIDQGVLEHICRDLLMTL